MRDSETLLPFFLWCESTFLGEAVRDSIWAFPIIEAVHLLGLSLLGGAVLIVDLRMLGLGLTRQSIGELAALARPWLRGAITVMLVTGVLLFLSEAIKCYYNTAFWVKITTLPFALLFTLGVRRWIRARPELDTSLATRALGFASLALWFTVAAAGRWIGYS